MQSHGILISLFLLNLTAFGQIIENDSTSNSFISPDTLVYPCDCDFCVEVDPAYPGGEMELYQYIQANSTFTPEMLALKLSGTVYIQFVIESDGSVSHVEVVRGIHDAYDQKAIELISNMPKWIPGKDACGRLIRVRYTIPVKFQSN